MGIAGACATELNRRLDAQERWEDCVRIEKKDYMRLKDWKDVAEQTEEMVPVLLALVDAGNCGEAKAYLAQMLEKAADDHAALVADRLEVGSW